MPCAVVDQRMRVVPQISGGRVQVPPQRAEFIQQVTVERRAPLPLPCQTGHFAWVIALSTDIVACMARVSSS
jgi:hypothetical protein